MVYMPDIIISEVCEDEDGYSVKVDVDGSEFEVTVTHEQYDRLTDGHQDVESLVRRTFEFLLAREPKEVIMEHFDLDTVAHFFPEYPQKIKQI